MIPNFFHNVIVIDKVVNGIRVEDQRNFVYHEELAPFEDASPSMASYAPSRSMAVLLGPRGGGDREVRLKLL